MCCTRAGPMYQRYFTKVFGFVALFLGGIEAELSS